MNDDRIIKSYVWHDERCFFVSTIERDSSAAVCPPPRYNETLVWAYDWPKRELGKLLYQEEDRAGSILRHLEVCASLFNIGTLTEKSDE